MHAIRARLTRLATRALRHRIYRHSPTWLKETRARHRPHTPSIWVLGDFDHLRKRVLFTALRLRGVEVTDQPGPPVAIKWAPWSLYKIPDELRPTLPATVINDTHFDCDKRNVEHHFEKVFQYPLAVDPLRHSGPMVQKSATNAAHDGRIINGPIDAAQTDCIYSLLIDTAMGDLAEDLRVPIIGSSIPLCYVKYRPINMRFSSGKLYSTLHWPHDIFSAEELVNIKRFARSIGLDYGELDILRDRSSMRIYIVDANNTPSGPPKGLSPRESAIAVHLIATTFCDQFLYCDHTAYR